MTTPPPDQPEVNRRNRRRRRRRLWFAPLAVLLLSASTVILLEIIVRIGGWADRIDVPRESYENAAAVDDSRNHLNLRERWQTPPGGANATRILFVGDSMTFGAGVEQEQCFVHLVEQKLNHAGPLRFVTINAGQPGTDPVEQLDLLAATTAALHPDIIVHVLYPNDLGHDLYEDLKKIHALQYRKSFPAQISHLWRLIERRIRYDRVFDQTVAYFRGGDSPFKQQRAWKRLRRGVIQAKQIADRNHARYVIVMFPWLARLDDYPLQDVHIRIRNLAHELGVPFFDLLDTFKGKNARNMRISIIDEHPSPQGHRIAANALAEFLRPLLEPPTD